MNEPNLEWRRILEQLSRDPGPQRSVATCRALRAEDRGLLEQRDTYFRGPQGDVEPLPRDRPRSGALPGLPRPRDRDFHADQARRPAQTCPPSSTWEST